MKKLLLGGLILLLAMPVMAQQARGRIIGTITTAEGAVITDATVTIASESLIAREMTTASNERGQFRFVLLPVGTYTLTIEKAGYATLTEEDIVVDFNTTVTVDKILQATAGEQTITITGEAPIVDKTSSSKGDKLDLEFLKNMPNQRTVFALPNLSAGFTDDSGLGGVQSAGNAFMVDGVDVSDPITATDFTTLNLEAVEQVDVNLFGANAEYGAFTGAALNVISKSGGNDFSGEANFFVRRVDWVGDNTGEYQQYGITAPAGEDVNDPNFSLGGPIMRDKVWFFGNYNYLDRTIVRNIRTGPIDEVWETNQGYGKVSARWDDRNISYFSYLHYERDRSHRLPQAFFTRNLLLESNLYQQISDNDMVMMQHSYVLSDNLILEGRVSLVDAAFDITPREMGPTVLHYVTSQFIGEPGISRTDLNTRDTDSYLVTADYFLDEVAGNHSIKAGFEHESNLGGRYFEWNNLWFVQDNEYGEFDQLTAGDIRLDFGQYFALARINRYGGFIQDSWQVNDRLTLNLGVRIDNHNIKADDTSTDPPLGSEEVYGYTEAAPRIGFAYDLFGDGKTVVRGFLGRFYENVVPGNVESLLANAPPQRLYFYDGADWVLFNESGGSSNFFIDEDIANQYTQGIMFGVEQQLTENIAGGVTFVYKKDEDIVGTISPNATWQESTVDFSNANGSYSGVWYPNYLAGSVLYGNPQNGDNGVLGDLERKFYGMIFEINKRMSDNWSMKASYTFSRNSGSAGQAYGNVQGFTSYSNPNGWINADGRAPLERPHVFKVSGTYIAPFDIFISPFFSWQSGWPKGDTLALADSTGVQVIAIEPIGGVDGDHRFDNQLNLDLRIEKAFVFAERYRVGFIVDIFNVTNDDSVTGRQSSRINSSFYDLPDTIVDPREYQVGVRLIF